MKQQNVHAFKYWVNDRCF